MSTTHSPGHLPAALSLGAERLILAAVLVSCLAALPIGIGYGQVGLALAGGLLLSLAAVAVVALVPDTLASRLSLAGLLAASVALHIQLSRGTVEFHFGVFVTLALLLFYRDWRPIVAAAALFAVHHVVFDRLQAAGVGVYCTTEANFPRVLLHALYVVVQTAAEAYIALAMTQSARQGDELGAIVRHVDHQGSLALDVQALPAATPLAAALKSALVRLNHTLVAVRHSAGSIQVASGEIASGSADLSRRTENTAGNLQQTASSMEQLAHNVRHSAESATSANQLARAAAAAAERGGAVMHEVVTQMEDISGSSRRIGDIIGTIDGIAFQTNILALNAAVEAARAGEQGRGFAVVASEVRSLAQRSAEAAREIKTLISASVEKVESGVHLVRHAGGTMDEIVTGVKRVSDIIGEITAATAEQSGGIGRMNEAVTELDQMTQQNAALVEESAAAAESMREQAARLASAVGDFRLDESTTTPA